MELTNWTQEQLTLFNMSTAWQWHTANRAALQRPWVYCRNQKACRCNYIPGDHAWSMQPWQQRYIWWQIMTEISFMLGNTHKMGSDNIWHCTCKQNVSYVFESSLHTCALCQAHACRFRKRQTVHELLAWSSHRAPHCELDGTSEHSCCSWKLLYTHAIYWQMNSVLSPCKVSVGYLPGPCTQTKISNCLTPERHLLLLKAAL